MKKKSKLSWLSNKTKIKRWILLGLIGIFLVCYGLCTIIENKTLEYKDIIKIVASFVIGAFFIIKSYVSTQKRMLELLVEDSDTRTDEKNNVNALIFNKKVYDQGPKVVCIGGGQGLNTVLRGLKNYTDNITAIVTLSDYGEIKTASAKELKMLPIEDIKGSVEALAYDEEKMKKLFDYKFDDENSKLKDLSFGDIYFSVVNKLYPSFTESVKDSGKILNMTGKVLPVTLDPITICAELENGDVIEEKDKIPEECAGSLHKIGRVYISPTNCKVAPGVLEAIREADAIVIGPGSLYTNVIPNLLVNGVAKEIKESKAIKIYVSNIMTELGQTDGFTLSDHIKTIIDYVGKGVIDYCIYDTGEVCPEYIHEYNLKGAELVLPDTSKVKEYGIKLIQRNLSKIENGKIIHDPDIIALTIIQLVCDELEFENMENNSQFMKLNSKLKEKKKELKEEQKRDKEFKKSGRKKFERKEGKSGFKEKYDERIKSIIDSDKN